MQMQAGWAVACLLKIPGEWGILCFLSVVYMYYFCTLEGWMKDFILYLIV
jgi:hypothetical protein